VDTANTDTNKILDMIGFGAASVLTSTKPDSDVDESIDAILAHPQANNESPAAADTSEADVQRSNDISELKKVLATNFRQFEGTVYAWVTGLIANVI